MLSATVGCPPSRKGARYTCIWTPVLCALRTLLTPSQESAPNPARSRDTLTASTLCVEHVTPGSRNRPAAATGAPSAVPHAWRGKPAIAPE